MESKDAARRLLNAAFKSAASEHLEQHLKDIEVGVAGRHPGVCRGKRPRDERASQPVAHRNPRYQPLGACDLPKATLPADIRGWIFRRFDVRPPHVGAAGAPTLAGLWHNLCSTAEA